MFSIGGWWSLKINHYLAYTPQDKALLLPKESEMPAKDKYTVFSSWDKGYRKGIHKVPKFTRVCGTQFVCYLEHIRKSKLCYSLLYAQTQRVSKLQLQFCYIMQTYSNKTQQKPKKNKWYDKRINIILQKKYSQKKTSCTLPCFIAFRTESAPRTSLKTSSLVSVISNKERFLTSR